MSIVAISRGTFTGGQALAERVAKRLGHRCVGRDELVEAATWYGVPAENLARVPDDPAPLWERLAGERTAYLDAVRAALCERAREGDLVYHGHVGHLLLPGISHVVRIRVIADMEFRLRAAMEQQGVAREEALAYVEKVDRERTEWTRLLYGVEWDDPALYDLVVNLSRLSIDGACELVAHMATLEEFRPTPRSLKAVADLGLSSRVSAVLRRDPRTRATGLRVTADGGEVTIAGVAPSPQVADAVIPVARGVAGVTGVKSEVALTVA